jgi:hypothetical protein
MVDTPEEPHPQPEPKKEQRAQSKPKEEPHAQPEPKEEQRAQSKPKEEPHAQPEPKEESRPKPKSKLGSNAARKICVPWRERCWLSISEAQQITGEGRTKLYESIATEKLLAKKCGRRRLVSVTSLLKYCGE